MQKGNKGKRSWLSLGVLGVKIGLAVEIIMMAGAYVCYYRINHNQGSNIKNFQKFKYLFVSRYLLDVGLLLI